MGRSMLIFFFWKSDAFNYKKYFEIVDLVKKVGSQ